jgi:hypothetical protein
LVRDSGTLSDWSQTEFLRFVDSIVPEGRRSALAHGNWSVHDV